LLQSNIKGKLRHWQVGSKNQGVELREKTSLIKHDAVKMQLTNCCTIHWVQLWTLVLIACHCIKSIFMQMK